MSAIFVALGGSSLIHRLYWLTCETFFSRDLTGSISCVISLNLSCSYCVTSCVATIAIFSLISMSRCFLLVPPSPPLRVRIGLSCLHRLFDFSLSLRLLLRWCRSSLSLPELLLLLLLGYLLLGRDRLCGPALSRFSYPAVFSHWGRLSSSVKPLLSRPDLAEDPLWSL